MSLEFCRVRDPGCVGLACNGFGHCPGLVGGWWDMTPIGWVFGIVTMTPFMWTLGWLIVINMTCIVTLWNSKIIFELVFKIRIGL